MSEAEQALYQTLLMDRRRRLDSAKSSLPDSADLDRLLEEVDAALVRLHGGTFGFCQECHDPIEEDRLMADPLTCFCLDHLNAEQRRALEQDLDLALRIQTSLLPERYWQTAGWEVFYLYQPAGPVSGDYCDLVKAGIPGGGLYFLTGDVSGKGVAASLLMSHLHATFRSLLSLGMSLTQLVEGANRLFCESTLPSHYATLVCGRAEASGDLELCNAGHCSPVLIRTQDTLTIQASGLPLGLFSSGQYPASRFHFDPGDTIFLYTDGLIEASGWSEEEFGLDRLLRKLESCHSWPAPKIVEVVFEELKSFLAGTPLSDDLTLVAIHRTGAIQ